MFEISVPAARNASANYIRVIATSRSSTQREKQFNNNIHRVKIAASVQAKADTKALKEASIKPSHLALHRFTVFEDIP